jgi:phosphopantothenoylcysteine decarboxylase
MGDVPPDMTDHTHSSQQQTPSSKRRRNNNDAPPAYQPFPQATDSNASFATQPLSPTTSSASAAASSPRDATMPPSTSTAPPIRTALLIVDCQNDFCTGSLKAPDALSIIPVINQLRVHYDWDLVVFSTDAHPTDHVSFHINHAADPAARLYQPYTLPSSGAIQVLWPVHCVQGTWGASIHNDVIRDPERDVVVEKGTERDQEFYSAFVSVDGKYKTNLEDVLRQHQITHLATCGLVYEYCVGNSSLDAAACGFRTVQVEDAVKHLTQDGMMNMRSRLQAAGVSIVQSKELQSHGFRPKPQRSSRSVASSSGQHPQSKVLPTHSQPRGIQLANPSSGLSPSPPPPATSTLLGSRYNFAHAQHPQLQQLFSQHQSQAYSPHRMAHSGSSSPLYPGHISGRSVSEYNLPSSRSTTDLTAAFGHSPSHAASTVTGSITAASYGSAQPMSPSCSAYHRAPLSPLASSASTVANSLSPTSSSAMAAPRPRVLLGLSGSVASIKVVALVEKLSRWCELRLITTGPALHFFSPSELQTQYGVKVYRDEDEWGAAPYKRGDPVLHIELRKWADLMLVAPLSANTLAKISHGLCDNLLTTTIRCWSYATHSLVIAPAMNTMMWDSPFTRSQLALLEQLRVRVIQPIAKVLACGDVGKGAMATVEEIDREMQEAWRGQVRKGYQQTEDQLSGVSCGAGQQQSASGYQLIQQQSPVSQQQPQYVPRLSHQPLSSSNKTPPPLISPSHTPSKLVQ